MKTLVSAVKTVHSVPLQEKKDNKSEECKQSNRLATAIKK